MQKTPPICKIWLGEIFLVVCNLNQVLPGWSFFAIEVAAILWGSLWSKQHAIFKTDIKGSVDAWNHGHFQANYMDVLRRDVQFVADHYNFCVDLSYIPSSANPVDTISRNRLDEFFAKNPTAISGPPFGKFPTHVNKDQNAVRKLCNLPIKE